MSETNTEVINKAEESSIEHFKKNTRRYHQSLDIYLPTSDNLSRETFEQYVDYQVDTMTKEFKELIMKEWDERNVT